MFVFCLKDAGDSFLWYLSRSVQNLDWLECKYDFFVRNVYTGGYEIFHHVVKKTQETIRSHGGHYKPDSGIIDSVFRVNFHYSSSYFLLLFNVRLKLH